jgi:hypothetical protein
MSMLVELMIDYYSVDVLSSEIVCTDKKNYLQKITK